MSNGLLNTGYRESSPFPPGFDRSAMTPAPEDREIAAIPEPEPEARPSHSPSIGSDYEAAPIMSPSKRKHYQPYPTDRRPVTRAFAKVTGKASYHQL